MSECKYGRCHDDGPNGETEPFVCDECRHEKQIASLQEREARLVEALREIKKCDCSNPDDCICGRIFTLVSEALSQSDPGWLAKKLDEARANAKIGAFTSVLHRFESGESMIEWLRSRIEATRLSTDGGNCHQVRDGRCLACEESGDAKGEI